MATAYKVKKDWPTGMIELAKGVFASIQPTGESGVSNAGLLVGDRSATLIDTLMVKSLNQPLVEAVKKTTSMFTAGTWSAKTSWMPHWTSASI